MVHERYRELLELIRGRAGDAFRTAVKYDADGWTVLYVRDDVATEQLGNALDSLVDRARTRGSIATRETYGEIGETQATVELHAEAVLLHFRESATDGVLVSLDRDIAQGLGQFVNGCNSVLYD